MRVTGWFEESPNRCEFCTASTPPVLNTEIPRPTGGCFQIGSCCWRPALRALMVWADVDYQALNAQLEAAREQVAPLDQTRAELAAVVVERDNALAERDQYQAENQTLTNDNGRLERDNADLRVGQMPRSIVPYVTGVMVDETLTEVAEARKPVKTPTRKTKLTPSPLEAA